LSEEDYAVVAIKVLRLELLHDIGVNGAVIERQILALASTYLAAPARAVFVVCRVLGGNEVQRKITCRGICGQEIGHGHYRN